MKSLTSLTIVSGAALSLTLFACGGTSFSGQSSADIRVSNLSSVATIDTNISDIQGSSHILSSALPQDDSTCPQLFDLDDTAPATLEVTAGGSSVNLLTTNVSPASDTGIVNSILVFGPTTGLKTLLVNSGEVDTDLKLFICDLGITDTNNYQVLIKNITASTSVQTSPVQGLDDHRLTSFPIDSAGTYEVDLVNGSTVVATSQFVIDADHPINIAAFVDNPSGTGLVARLVHGDEGCVLPQHIRK